jgi:hypothetical protein
VKRLSVNRLKSRRARKLVFDYSLESYDNEMQLVNSSPREKKKKKKKVERVITEQVAHLMVKDKLYVFNAITDLNLKTFSLEMDEVDKSSLTNVNEPRRIAEVSYEEGSRKNKGGFNVAVSSDDSKILVYSIFPYEKGQVQKFRLQVYDNDLNELWNNLVELPYNEELFEVAELKVGNDGNVYLLGKVYEDKHREKKKGEVNYKYHVIYYTKDNLNGYDTPINTKNKFINDIAMTINSNNQVVCVGLYTSSFYDVSEGTFYLRIDSKTHKNEVLTFKEFSDLSEDNGKDSERKKKRKQSNAYRNYVFRRIINHPDGGVTVVAEQYNVIMVRTTTSSPGGGTSTKTSFEYHYNNILVLKIDKNGKFLWQKIIPKSQDSKDDFGYYLSFALGVKGEDLYFIFLTTKYRTRKDGTERASYWTKNYLRNLSLHKLDKDGNFSGKINILDGHEARMKMVPKSAFQINENEILIHGKTFSKNCFGIIEMD